MTDINADFTFDVNQFVQGSQNLIQKFAREFLQDVNAEVVMATPYVTGHLRASWYANINSAGFEAGGVDPSGSDTIARLNIVAAEWQPGDTYYLCNGAVYAARVEFGFIGTDSLGRRYNQQPRAFVRGTLSRLDEIAQQTMDRIAGSSA